ncbi:paraplegin-like isoform X3 [Dreissena polymorpha]|nr:paraplegin-like isoform X3 [Dreissena polymorpha]
MTLLNAYNVQLRCGRNKIFLQNGNMRQIQCFLNTRTDRTSRNVIKTSRLLNMTYCQTRCLKRQLDMMTQATQIVCGSRFYCSAPDNQPKKDTDKPPRNGRIFKLIIPRPELFLVAFGLFILFIIGDFNRDTAISWEEFKTKYLLEGRVKKVFVRTYSNDLEVAFVQLHPLEQIVLPGEPDKVAVRMTKVGDFLGKLRDFEAEYNVPRGEQIPYQYEDARWLIFFQKLAVFAISLGLLGLYFWSKRSLMNLLPRATMFKNEQEFKDFLNKQREGMKEMNNTSKEASQKTRKPKIKRPEKISEFMDLFDGDQFSKAEDVLEGKFSFKDVAGLHEAKIEVQEFIDYIKTPEKFEEIGARTPKGALLLGPPGCGKTLLGKALAGECGVPFYYAAGSEFLKMIGGMGAAKVRKLFREAREDAPCIIFIDEVDAIGKKRASGTSDIGSGAETDADQTLNQLLAEMDGMKTTQGVIVIAATNRADTLDKALMRPGRFDRHITIDLPTMKERVELFELYLRKLKLSLPVSSLAPRLAQLTPRMSGADIANICNEAAIHAAREMKKHVHASDLNYACERVIAGQPKLSNPVSIPERKVIAYHEAGHVLVGWLLEHTDALLKVTVVPRTSATLGFAQYVPRDTRLYTKDQLFDFMVQLLGGRAAEDVMFNSVTSGAKDDLDKVTKLAYAQIKTYGMSEKFGLLSFPVENESGLKFGPKPFSRRTDQLLDQEVRVLVGKAYRQAVDLINKNKDKLHELAQLLQAKETLQYSEVEALLGPCPFGKKVPVDPGAFFDEDLHEEKAAKEEADKIAEEAARKADDIPVTPGVVRQKHNIR